MVTAWVLAATVVIASSAAAATDPWAKGSQWMSVRAGYAKVSGKQAGNSFAGYGMGFSRMLNKKWSLGLYAHHEVLGRLAGSTQVEVPFTAELVRHYRWKTPLRPYLGAGGGVFSYGTRRTGEDYLDARGGGYLLGGMNTPLNERQRLGMDVRFAFVNGDESRVNPVFGTEKKTMYQVSAKLNWSFAY